MQSLKRLNLLFIVTLAIAFCSCGSVQPLEVKSIENFKVNNISKGKIDLTIEVVIDNPNSFSVKVKDVAFDVKINNLNLGEIKYPKAIKLKRNGKTTTKLDIETSIGKLLLQAPGALLAFQKENTVPLELNGKFKAGKLFIYKSYSVSYADEIDLKSGLSL